MYCETRLFIKHNLRRKEIVTDGDFRTAVFLALGSFVLFWLRPGSIDQVVLHFGDLLTVASIVFGFATTAFVFLIASSSTWKQKRKVQEVGAKIVDCQARCSLTILTVIGYVVVLWAWRGTGIGGPLWWSAAAYGLLVFLGTYAFFQAVNNTLNLWWYFYRLPVLGGEDNFEGRELLFEDRPAVRPTGNGPGQEQE